MGAGDIRLKGELLAVKVKRCDQGAAHGWSCGERGWGWGAGVCVQSWGTGSLRRGEEGGEQSTDRKSCRSGHSREEA
jgi:hypothetical protein